MRLTGIHVNRHLASLLICVILPLSSLLPFTNATAAPSGNGPSLAPGVQGATPLVIEGRVEQTISEMQLDGLITSRAIVTVDEVVQGTLQGNQVTIHYLGGTVGELTLRVSDEPYLGEGMRLRVKLTPDEGGDYRIANPDTDLTILEGVGVAYVPTGETWPVTSIPVPIRINANTGDVPGDGERTAVQNAMTTWTNASCSYFAYSYQAGSCTTGPLYDGVNCVSWTTQSGGGALSTSYWWYSGSTTLETDIVFYDGHTWSTNGSAFDVESVALHELGHSLGLAHNNADPAIVMYYAFGSGQIKRSLHTDDRNGVCALYPNPLPTAPSNLTATPVSLTQINLSWTDNSDNESGFKIERSPDGSSWAQIDTVGANVTTYPDTDLTCNTPYYYRVRAYNASGDSDYSNVANATTPDRDNYESDDTYTNAKPITVNALAQTHCFHQAGDEDWAEFEVTAGEVYTITTSNLDASNDTVLELYDTDGSTMLTSNDNCPGGGSLASCINNWTDPGTGTYFIRVRHSNHPNEGDCTGYDYDLRVVDSRWGVKALLPIIFKNSQ